MGFGGTKRGHQGMVTTPKCHPSLHWGPLWELMAPDGGRTQRDGDNPKVSPKLHWGPLWDLVAPPKMGTGHRGW